MLVRVLIVGLLMGAAEVVPGVSGGTIAFVSGFYQRLVNGVQRFTPMCLPALLRLGLRRWWREFDVSFLLLLFGSMLVSVLVLARGVSYLLEFHAVLIWAFFFGLVLASVFVVGQKLKPLTVETGVAAALGASFGLLVVQMLPMDVEASALVLFGGGCIAVCAWILPGVSGSFMLLILGLYPAVIGAVRDLDLPAIAWLALGCIVGLISFSRILSLLLARFYRATIAVLVGFMAGSLVRIWPWKYTTRYQLDVDGSQIPVVQQPVLPYTYEYLTGNEPELLAALLAFALGVVAILALDRFVLVAAESGRKDAGKS